MESDVKKRLDSSFRSGDGSDEKQYFDDNRGSMIRSFAINR